MDALPSEQWEAEVVTAQGRTVPASETPWMRAREVMVHAVDLGTGVTFDRPARPTSWWRCATTSSPSAAPPRAARRPGRPCAVEATDTPSRWDIAGVGEPVPVDGTLAAVAAYLSGRSADGVRTSGADPVPELPAWL